MTQLPMTQPPSDAEFTLTAQPRSRSWILMSLLALFTVLFIAVATEFIARRAFTELKTSLLSCIVLTDPSTGARGIPNSVCTSKSPDLPPVTFKFNNCGHRSDLQCNIKTPDSFRIVMMGSSFALGEGVQQEQTFAELLPVELSRDTGHPVELYNEGMGWGFSHSTDLRFNDVLAAKPDLVLWIMTPMDVKRAALVLPTADLDPYAGLSLRSKFIRRVHDTFLKQSPAIALAAVYDHTRTAMMLRHFLYSSPTLYLKSYLIGTDADIGYLNADLSPVWQQDLQQVNSDAADMEQRANAAGVPFVAVFVPDRAEADMYSIGAWPDGYNPYTLPDKLRSIILSHHGYYVDITQHYRNLPNAINYYYPVDGHPNAQGHRLIAKFIAQALTSGAVPQITALKNSHIASAGAR